MICNLCNDSISKSGTLRPNVATYECGHEFHLSCVLSYARENITVSCPLCEEKKEAQINLGDDRSIAIQSLIDARRCIVADKKKSFLSWFTDQSLFTMIKSGTSLDSLKLKGVRPEDIIEERINWSTISKIYKTSALLDFGFRWHHMITMGFQPEHFKLLDWHQMTEVLNLKASDMLKTSLNISQLSELKIDIAHLHELGFRLKELKTIGGNCETLQLLTKNLSDIKTYFNPSTTDWENLGFTQSAIEKHGWETEEFTPARKTRQMKLVKSKNGFVF